MEVMPDEDKTTGRDLLEAGIQYLKSLPHLEECKPCSGRAQLLRGAANLILLEDVEH